MDNRKREGPIDLNVMAERGHDAGIGHQGVELRGAGTFVADFDAGFVGCLVFFKFKIRFDTIRPEQPCFWQLKPEAFPV